MGVFLWDTVRFSHFGSGKGAHNTMHGVTVLLAMVGQQRLFAEPTEIGAICIGDLAGSLFAKTARQDRQTRQTSLQGRG